MRSRRRSSIIWLHFQDLGNNKAKCQFCGLNISFRAGSTTNLHRHVRTVHPAVQMDKPVLLALASTEDASIEVTSIAAASIAPTAFSDTAPPACPPQTQSKVTSWKPKRMSRTKRLSIDDELAKMIAADFQPISIVDDKGFTGFVKALNPFYSLPSKKTLSETLIPKLYRTECAKWKARVNTASSVCLTIECWTSKASRSFISVTSHFIENYKMTSCLLDCFECTEHSVENMANELLRVAQEWQVEDKVVCCVSDDSPNTTKALETLKWTHNPCLAHTINAMMEDALRIVKETVEKVKAIVDLFLQSPEATEMMTSFQEQLGLSGVKLKSNCPTRWNSTFTMLKRVLDLKEAIILTHASVVDSPVDPLSEEDWQTVKEVCTILEPFEEVMKEISADSYVTASKMLVLCKGLQRVTTQHQQTATTNQAKEVTSALGTDMYMKFLRLEHDTVLSEATLLDPRFKKLALSDCRAIHNACQRLNAAVAGCSPSTETALPSPSQDEAEPQSSAVWSFFDKIATGDAAMRELTADAVTEVNTYLSEPIIQRAEDPLSWWRAKASVYPRLVKVMVGRLCVVATSAPAERIFSSNQTVTRRKRMCPSNLKYQVFLNANLQ